MIIFVKGEPLGRRTVRKLKREEKEEKVMKRGDS
jgi:hypothetical protein